jgi:molybdopterin/thiamine biosynthesis adenylyltransferase
MNFSRISQAIDVSKTQASCVTVVGAGGSVRLITDLARCGVERFQLVDPDRVTVGNMARQAHDETDVGLPKVEAVAAMLKRVNRRVQATCVPHDLLALSEDEIDALVRNTDLLILATDRFAAQARGNELALQYGKPALWIGLYAGGLAGEGAFWHPDIDACLRCLCAKRYAAHEQASQLGRSLDPASDGCTIFDIGALDSVAGALAIGLLTRGSDNRVGRLIDRLGQRNFFQMQLDPDWNFQGRNPVREQLGVADDCPAFFAWNTIFRADPDRGQLPCPYCARFRGHVFIECDGISVRLKPPFAAAADDI